MAIQAPKHLRGIEPFLIPLNLLRGQAGKVIAVRRSTAQEERTAHDIVYLAVLIP